jgi:hypothetical protein
MQLELKSGEYLIFKAFQAAKEVGDVAMQGGETVKDCNLVLEQGR